MSLLQPEKRGNWIPISQVRFALQRLDMLDARLEGVQTKWINVAGRGRSTRDITFYVWKKGECLQVKAEYNANLFRAAAICRILEQYKEIVFRLASAPAEKVA